MKPVSLVSHALPPVVSRKTTPIQHKSPIDSFESELNLKKTKDSSELAEKLVDYIAKQLGFKIKPEINFFENLKIANAAFLPNGVLLFQKVMPLDNARKFRCKTIAHEMEHFRQLHEIVRLP
ncbi:MAG: hypothetical protein MZV70_69970 [Desulfobacterales bacterium]|nr:hypothetical protein [Desulfobacterales bacterium]